MKKINPYHDNVLIVLEPKEQVSSGGIHLVHKSGPKARGSRFARVIESGRGYPAPIGNAFVENTVKPGDRVLVDELAGQSYDFDLSAPRHQEMAQEFPELFGERGEFRVVREGEILGVLEDG